VTRCRRGGAAWLLAALLACATPAQALQLVDASVGLVPAESARSKSLLDAAARRLPATWERALGRVPVAWRDDLPADVHGRALDGSIVLRRALLHDPSDRPALAALVHELAHLYDRSSAGGLSRDPRLLDLAGWEDAPLRPWRTRNRASDRSPDPYELDNPREFVAVNLEHFLLDADYACRRPALSRYFAQAFATTPTTPDCPAGLPFLQASADSSKPLLEIDPSRVYAVDYLLAEGNERPMSHWGHSMLRLVVCAPGRAPGPDCRLDIAYHEVLSFRAFVDDVQVSSWRGLTGDYPSRLFLLPFAQVVDEYTKVELRGLRSIPLRLPPADIATLLERAAQLHWSYDGRYYFIGNNCAVETARLLQVGIPRLAGTPLMAITPNGLLSRLARAGLADPAPPADRAEAIRQGYYFEPMSARYQAMYDVARRALQLPARRVGDWLALPPARRAAVFTQADRRTSAALLLLEQAALRRRELDARDALKRRLLGPQRDAAREVLGIEALLARPASLLDAGGYGLPQAGERDALAQSSARLAQAWQRQRTSLLARARQWLPAGIHASMDGTEANIATLQDRIRALNAAEGGLRLN
jgi:hypothetical protein